MWVTRERPRGSSKARGEEAIALVCRGDYDVLKRMDMGIKQSQIHLGGINSKSWQCAVNRVNNKEKQRIALHFLA